MRDPGTGDKNPAVGFIEVMLSQVDSNKLSSPADLLDLVAKGRRIVVLGDYGAGKSMVLRHMYQELSKAHLRGLAPRFPVFVNLRDHYGQTDPAELLERHARNVGLGNPAHLVKAWRAGFVDLLLDGFDEITTLSIQGLWTKLKDNRYRAMEAVRRLMRDHPQQAGLVISGRAHFFDSVRERRTALALSGAFSEFSLSEFNEDQIIEYLRRSGLKGSVPPWLPSRPLLLGYLAARGILADIAIEASSERAAGWDSLIDDIASREAQIEAGIDGHTVRRILERLATKARANADGIGPIPPDMLIGAFTEICGYAPDERGMVLLQRLPGLGVDREEEGTRIFIDEDFADACRAGDLFQFLDTPFGIEGKVIAGVDCASGPLGVEVTGRRATRGQFSAGKVNAAIRRSRDLAATVFTSDLCRIAIDCGHPIEEALSIRGVVVPELEFTARSGNAALLEFQDCFFGRIGLDLDIDPNALPRFRSCYFGEVDGRASAAELPTPAFDAGCIVESFSEVAATTDAVLSLHLPLGVRVVITILKKLYERRGAGRRENALFRGLDHRARRLVPAALQLIRREGLAEQVRRGTDTIWRPDRSKMRRVGRIISAPTSREDSLVAGAASLE